MRSTFGRSRLVRSLGEWAAVEAPAAGMDFAERLALWLNTFDAIHLQGAQQAMRAVDAAASADGSGPRRAARAPDLAQDLQRVRGTLAQAIAQDPFGLAGLPAPVRQSRAPQADPPPADPGYGPFHQRHLELQRQMAMVIGPLREHVRDALSRGSPALRRLAVLDAAFEQVLARREQTLLPLATALLKRRFEQLRRAGAAAGTEGGWLDAFARDWREALLAELELRLEPVTGLVEALTNEARNQ